MPRTQRLPPAGPSLKHVQPSLPRSWPSRKRMQPALPPSSGQSARAQLAAATADSAPPPLPEGWREAKHPDGRTYYFAKGTMHTQWARPTESAAAMGLVAPTRLDA